jgi:prepilin-type processing-associated H-X9-DG protein
MNQNHYHSAISDNIHAMQRQTKRIALTLVELLVIIAIIGVLVALLLPSVRTGREAARRNQCQNNLKQIAIALKRYEKANGALPPAYTTDADGKPLHSWRTLILPYIEEQALYESIDLTKPWDDVANAEAARTSVFTYQCSSTTDDDNRTTYLAVVSPTSCFRAAEPRSVSEITDRASETLMVIEVDSEHADPWMSPEDAHETLVLGLGGPKSRTPHPAGMNAAFVDGHVQFLSFEMPADVRRAMISIAGNESLDGVE